MLEFLDISDNLLSSPLDLSPLTQLRGISLGQRNLENLTVKHFLELPSSLTSLEISHSHLLLDIEEDSLGKFTGLENLNISHNSRLRHLPASLCSSLELLTVDLSHNDLRVLRSDSLPWARLTRLEVGGNPLDCDCQMAWLVSLLPSIHHQGATCHLPLALRGSNLTKLTQLAECQSVSPWILPSLLITITLLLILLSLLLVLWRCNRHKAGVTDLSQPSLVFPDHREDLGLYWDLTTPHHTSHHHLYWPPPPQAYQVSYQQQRRGSSESVLERRKDNKIVYNGIYTHLTQSRQKSSKSRNIWNSLRQKRAVPDPGQETIYTLADSPLHYDQRDIIYLDLLKDCGRH